MENPVNEMITVIIKAEFNPKEIKREEIEALIKKLFISKDAGKSEDTENPNIEEIKEFISFVVSMLPKGENLSSIGIKSVSLQPNP
ncbi:hypothetical protein KAT63_04300 [Candidatus Parcubacteria bacterium]|nr:hypothetical protein [Candidatus Parcubacteria bacterium]